MTSALNRKFDVLARSGTCPPYLLDVLSLLVAHANDTELYKTEMRSAPYTNGGGGKDGGVLQRTLPSVQAAEEALQDTVKASHETILLAAEHSLRAYAEDLKKVNEVAMATSAKLLRELRSSTQHEMDGYRDRLCEAAVGQSTRELEVLQMEWLEGVRAEAERLKSDVDLIASQAERAIQEKAADYAAFVARAHEVLNTQLAVDTHEAVAAGAMASVQVNMLSASAAAKADVDLLADRLKQAERAIARMSAHLFPDGDGVEVSYRSDPPPKERQTAREKTPTRRAGSDRSSAGVSPVVSLLMGSRDGPVTGVNGSANTSLHNPPSALREARWNVPQLAISVEADHSGDGVVVTAVQTGSVGAVAGLKRGFLVSHVDRTGVLSPDDMRRAIDAARSDEAATVRLTVYDPEAGRVRLVTLDL